LSEVKTIRVSSHMPFARSAFSSSPITSSMYRTMAAKYLRFWESKGLPPFSSTTRSILCKYDSGICKGVCSRWKE